MDNNFNNVQGENQGNGFQEGAPIYNSAPQYTQPAYQNQAESETPVTIGEWIITFLVMCIPCVNIVMMFVWAFGSGKKSRQNYFKAYLIIYAIVLVLLIVIIAVFGVSLLDALKENDISKEIF